LSTFDYAAVRVTALRLLAQFGNAVALIREDTGGTYDPVSGGTTGGSDLTLNGTGVLLDYMAGDIDGSLVLATDRKLLYQGDALQVGDKFGAWRVLSIGDLDPDESGTLLTTAQMRR